MLKDGDKVLVCVSGGKDSLSLLHALKQHQYFARSKGVRFEIGAATVDPGTDAYNPRPLVVRLMGLCERGCVCERACVDVCVCVCVCVCVHHA